MGRAVLHHDLCECPLVTAARTVARRGSCDVMMMIQVFTAETHIQVIMMPPELAGGLPDCDRDIDSLHCQGLETVAWNPALGDHAAAGAADATRYVRLVTT